MSPSPPKHAASIILLRPSPEGSFEVLLTRRPSRMRFLGGMYVFPGGGVRKDDCSEALLRRCYGLSPEQAQKILGSELAPALCLGHWNAGIRELYEEVGILLCVSAEGGPISVNGATRERLAEKRRAIIEGTIDFKSFLESEGLLCDASRLGYFSHWLTPAEFTTRFDTRFYLALLPADQAPLRSSEEVSESLWVTPERALSLCEQGSLPVIFPTFASLRTLADFDALDSVLAEYRPSVIAAA